MGLRFRKSFKLAPGVRMNLSSGGVSWSLGPRGASISVGKRGTFLNTGLPGTGLSARVRLDRPAAPAKLPSPTVTLKVTVEVTDDGQVNFRDQMGNPLPSSVEREAKLQHPETIRSLISQKCCEINDQIDSLATLHRYTPAPNRKPQFQRLPYGEKEPTAPVAEEYGLMAKMASRIAKGIDAQNAARREDYDRELANYQRNRQLHDDAQTALKQDFFSAIAGTPEAMERLLENELSEIVWPRETLISLLIASNGDRVYLDVDLPEIEHMPRSTASVKQSGFGLSLKRMSDTDYRKLYMQHVHAIGFRLMGEVFAALPTVVETIVSGYSQRVDSATGHISDEYLYSVKANRAQWGAINFDSLDAVDVVDTFARFQLRRTLSKSGVFVPIAPYELDSVGIN